jgi:hypothetical protein
MKWGVMVVFEKILVIVMMLERILSGVDSLFFYIFNFVSRIKMFCLYTI